MGGSSTGSRWSPPARSRARDSTAVPSSPPGAPSCCSGASGAGKSTLTNVLLGADAQETGDVRPDRRGAPHHDPPGAPAAARRRGDHRHARHPGRHHLGRPRRGGGPPHPSRIWTNWPRSAGSRTVPTTARRGAPWRPGGGRRHLAPAAPGRVPGLSRRAHRAGGGAGGGRPVGAAGAQPPPALLSPVRKGLRWVVDRVPLAPTEGRIRHRGGRPARVGTRRRSGRAGRWRRSGRARRRRGRRRRSQLGLELLHTCAVR